MSSLTSATPTQRVSGLASPGRVHDGTGSRLVTDRPAGTREPALALHARARLQKLLGALSEGGWESALVLGCAGQGARHHLVHPLRPGDGHLTRHSLDQVVPRRAVERVRV